MRRPEGEGLRLWSFVAALRSNHWSKLLSLSLAVLAWLYVQGEEIREERVQVQVAWTLPDELVATEPLPVTAFLIVRGSRTAINLAHASPIRIVVDVAEFTKGEHTVDLAGMTPEGLPPAVERLGVQPSSIHFDLDKVATHNVRIDPVLVGDPQPGFRIDSVIIEPAVVLLRGPEQAVSSLREVPTRPIDVSGISRATSREVALDLPRSVDLAKNVVIRAALEITSQTEQRRIEDVPVYAWGNERLAIEPLHVSVMLEGPAEQLRALRTDQVVAFVHLVDSGTNETWPIDVAHGPREGTRIELIHSGDNIAVISMLPPSVKVSPVK